MGTEFQFPVDRRVIVIGNNGYWKPHNQEDLEKTYVLEDDGRVEFQQRLFEPIVEKRSPSTNIEDQGNSEDYCNLGGPNDRIYKLEEVTLYSLSTKFEDHGGSVDHLGPSGPIATFKEGEVKVLRVDGKLMYPRIRNLGRRPNQLPK